MTIYGGLGMLLSGARGLPLQPQQVPVSFFKVDRVNILFRYTDQRGLTACPCSYDPAASH